MVGSAIRKEQATVAWNTTEKLYQQNSVENVPVLIVTTTFCPALGDFAILAFAETEETEGVMNKFSTFFIAINMGDVLRKLGDSRKTLFNMARLKAGRWLSVLYWKHVYHFTWGLLFERSLEQFIKSWKVYGLNWLVLVTHTWLDCITSSQVKWYDSEILRGSRPT